MVAFLTLAGLAMCAGKARWAGVLICMAAASHWNSQQAQHQAPATPLPICTDAGTRRA